MNAQMTMWEADSAEMISQAIKKLQKIQNQQQGLFKRLHELKQESEILSAVIEEINHHHIYGNMNKK